MPSELHGVVQKARSEAHRVGSQQCLASVLACPAAPALPAPAHPPSRALEGVRCGFLKRAFQASALRKHFHFGNTLRNSPCEEMRFPAESFSYSFVIFISQMTPAGSRQPFQLEFIVSTLP